jgi:5-methyltetrahydropteroyltriglutamate--homocysteine methyltransferase
MAVLAGVARRKPLGMTLGIHICRGNGPRGSWFATGGYEPIADALFNRVDADRYLLEYDTERAGDFAPLRHLKGDKVVVLGVVSTKVPTLEDASLLKSRIEEAARHAPLENLAISPQCGFSSSMVGLPLTIDDEKRKLERMVGVAREVWH